MSARADFAADRLRIVYFGSGAFGLPTLQALAARHEIAAIVSQPDRPAGRARAMTPTVVSAFAREHRVRSLTPASPSDREFIRQVHSLKANCFVVIAYGHKLTPDLLGETFAINLHASLLPKYRGAAPINWAMIHGECETGVSVIRLAQRMDAGEVLGSGPILIDPLEVAGELHDRLAALGPPLILQALERWRAGKLDAAVQDEQLATPAPKLCREDGTVRFDQPAKLVRCRVHGLTPWPGCWVRVSEGLLRLHRVREVVGDAANEPPGTMLENGALACLPGQLQVLEVQPAGGRTMPFADYLRGHRPQRGARFEALA